MKLSALQSIDHHAVLFADISGSTRMYEAIGDTTARRIVVRVFSLLSDAIHRFEGMLIKTIGDEMMCLFGDAESAARSSLDMQRSLRDAALADSNLSRLAIRIGFHAGEVIRERADVFGDAVNTAARVVAQAKGRQILTTKETLDMLPAGLRDTTRFVDHIAVKGKLAQLHLYELIWDSAGLTAAESSRNVAQSGTPKRLVLRFQQQEVVLDKEKCSVQLGRGEENDFVVQDSLVSRAHAKIEFRRDKFVLIDQSINGTYVLIYGEREECVRRDEMVLRGSGIISPGRVSGSGSIECVHFLSEQ
jgi:class 3 adenylate cyclase